MCLIIKEKITMSQQTVTGVYTPTFSDNLENQEVKDIEYIPIFYNNNENSEDIVTYDISGESLLKTNGLLKSLYQQTEFNDHMICDNFKYIEITVVSESIMRYVEHFLQNGVWELPDMNYDEFESFKEKTVLLLGSHGYIHPHNTKSVKPNILCEESSEYDNNNGDEFIKHMTEEELRDYYGESSDYEEESFTDDFHPYDDYDDDDDDDYDNDYDSYLFPPEPCDCCRSINCGCD
jgi:hypothetical protein